MEYELVNPVDDKQEIKRKEKLHQRCSTACRAIMIITVIIASTAILVVPPVQTYKCDWSYSKICDITYSFISGTYNVTYEHLNQLVDDSIIYEQNLDSNSKVDCKIEDGRIMIYEADDIMCRVWRGLFLGIYTAISVILAMFILAILTRIVFWLVRTTYQMILNLRMTSTLCCLDEEDI